MAKLNKLYLEEVVYTKDGVEKKYKNLFLDVSVGEYRYRIPLACSDKGELSKVFREVKDQCDGVYELTYVGE